MSESLTITLGSKQEQYTNLIPQIKALIAGEPDLIANMANVCAALKVQFDWLWIGFYIVRENQLVLGPFQGPIACTRIQYNKGVCGTAWSQRKTIIVPDVDQFPGHNACSSLSKSEIVIPLLHEHKVIAVLDIDSIDLSTFDTEDQYYLEQVLLELGKEITI